MKSFNKILIGVLCLAMLSFSSCVFADENSDVISVYVDSTKLNFDVNPITENDRTLVPMRAIFEALGATVTWDDMTQTATAVKNSDTMSITIDNKILYKNGLPIELDVPARMVNDRTLVPVRAVSESFDATVDWSEDTLTVDIRTSKPASTTDSAQTATPDPSAAPTKSPEEVMENGISGNMLTDNDMVTLKGMQELIRYEFEQSAMPGYVFENGSKMYKMLTDDKDGFANQVLAVWNSNLVDAIIELQIESDSTYIFAAEEMKGEILDYYGDIIEKSGLGADNFIDNVYYAVSDDGLVAAVIELHSADSFVQCKYLSIVVSKDGVPRYFTAENDVMQTDIWFFCEVTESSRSTIGYFDKNEKAFDSFVEISFKVYRKEN